MKIKTISLLGSPALLEHSSLSLNLSDLNPAIVYGPNGSGKSLVVSALKAVFDKHPQTQPLIQELASAGLEKIKLEIETRENSFELSFSFVENKLTIHSEYANLLNQHLEVDKELFLNLFLIESGKTPFEFSNQLLLNLSKIAKTPFERELAGWNFKKTKLIGGDGQEGRLNLARQEYKSFESEINRMESLLKKAQEQKKLEQQLLSQQTSLLEQKLVLESEQNELQKIITLSQRALRLQSWIDELAIDRAKVIQLRDEHLKFQDRLELLENKFRNTPDDFETLLTNYHNEKERQNSLNEKIEELGINAQGISDKIESLRKSLQNLTFEEIDSHKEVVKSIEEDIASKEHELLELLRNRISILRQREGIQQEIYKEFPQYSLLEPHEYSNLFAYLSFIVENPETQSPNQQNSKQLTEELEKTRTLLKEFFRGYENLPNDSSSLLQSLFEIRKNIQTAQGQTEILRKKNYKHGEKSANSFYRALYIGGMSALAFGGVTAVSSWDIGAFAGLAASGIALLTQRFVFRKSESQFEANLVNLQATEKQLKIAFEAQDNLERVLGPLANLENYQEAVEKYAEYKRLADRETELSIEQVVQNSQKQNYDRAFDSLKLRLPQFLQNKKTADIQTEFKKYSELKIKLDSFDSEWSHFEEGGRKTVLISLLETQISEQKELLTRHSTGFQTVFESKKNEKKKLEVELKELSAQQDYTLNELSLTKQMLSDAQNKVENYLNLSNGVLQNVSNEDCSSNWAELKDLRVTLREVRNKLSHHQSLDEITARQSLLSEEFDEVTEKLRELDLLYLLNGTVADYADKYENQMQGLKNSLDELGQSLSHTEESLHSLEKESVKHLIGQESEIDELNNKKVAIQKEIQTFEEDLGRANEFILTLKEELENFDTAFIVNTQYSISKKLSELTHGSFTGLKITPDGALLIENNNGQIRRIESLSGGMQDLVWLSLRFCLIDSVKNLQDFPLIWDEPFARLDEQHLNDLWKMISEQSVNRQIILFAKDIKNVYETKVIEIRQQHHHHQTH